MIGMTDLVIVSTSKMLVADLSKSYKKNNTIISGVEKEQGQFTISFPTTIPNDEKEGIFTTLVEKIVHLRDPADRKMDTKVEARFLQQGSKEYFFSKGELVRYRGFFDTDNPLPMVRSLIGKLHE